MLASDHLSSDLIGWFAIGFSHEVKPGQQKNGILATKAFVLSRTFDGCLILDGEIDNVLEQNTIIYAWHHPLRLKPYWQIPILDETKWSAFLYNHLTAYSHPQEVYENCVDLAHFSIVHSYHDLYLVNAPIFAEHQMSIKHLIRRKCPIFLGMKPIVATFEVCLHGIGCAINHIDIPNLGLRVRMLVLTTPIDNGLIEIRLAIAIAQHTKNLLKRIGLPIIHYVAYKNIVKDFCQDLRLWEHKCYQISPLLVKGDGPIMKFRQWCKQFYLKEKMHESK